VLAACNPPHLNGHADRERLTRAEAPNQHDPRHGIVAHIASLGRTGAKTRIPWRVMAKAAKRPTGGAPVKRPRGRPVGGRSSDERYRALTIYVPRDLHAEVGARLLREGRGFSDVIERLLLGWLKEPAKD
jgi:hypothetical protein